jgi:hypothetical protein
MTLTRLPTRLVVVTELVLLVAAGCWLWRGGASPHPHHRPGAVKPGDVVLHGSDAFYFTRLPSMVATAHTVVVGTVVSAGRGAVIDIEEIRYTQRVLQVRVEQVLAGRKVAGSVRVSVGGWRQIRGHPEARFRAEHEMLLEPGDRVLLFLYDFKGDGGYAVVNHQGAYVVRGGAFESSGNPDPLVVTLERKTLAVLERDILDTSGDIRRGRYHATPYPGTG